MTTKQQNYNFIQDVVEGLGRWLQKPTLLMINTSLVLIVILIGGLFFWVSQFDGIFIKENNQSQLEVARAGLQTMKRMVGNQQVWSESIQEEYNKIFINQSVSALPISDNFVGPNYPIIKGWRK